MLVAGAVAGDDFSQIAGVAAQALGAPVVISIPALGDPVVAPPGSIDAPVLAAFLARVADLIDGKRIDPSGALDNSVAIRIGAQVVGAVVVCAGGAGAGTAGAEGDGGPSEASSAGEVGAWAGARNVGEDGDRSGVRHGGKDGALAGARNAGENGALAGARNARKDLRELVEGGADAVNPEPRPWLEAAATAAAVTAMMREAQQGTVDGARRVLLQALVAGPPADLAAWVGHARELGFDLGRGAVGICARWPAGTVADADQPRSDHGGLVAVLGDKLFGLLPLNAALADSSGSQTETAAASRSPVGLADIIDASGSPPGHVDRSAPIQPQNQTQTGAQALAAELTGNGLMVALSAPRRDPAALHEALREAELLVELAVAPDPLFSGQEETYRLLIGVLLRDPLELELLCSRTISSLVAYDVQHDTELLATLRAFLAHHGSTTETSVAMRLHRHTVGYRLARLHEISGLSPYESYGRERLSLGLKAHQILKAERQRAS
ncbi:MAG: PucR family transcriptional regulator [Solirubrobacteraceae bacterium]